MISPHLCIPAAPAVFLFIKQMTYVSSHSGFHDREDMVILENVDFVHHTPMTVLPIGAMCEIDCEEKSFSIMEAGVR